MSEKTMLVVRQGDRRNERESLVLYRPWGKIIPMTFKTIQSATENFQVSYSLLFINPGEELSVQRHRLRDERFIAASGTVGLRLGRDPEHMREVIVPRSGIVVRKGIWHQLRHIEGKHDAVVFEEACGKQIAQSDIERFSDSHGRALNVSTADPQLSDQDRRITEYFDDDWPWPRTEGILGT